MEKKRNTSPQYLLLQDVYKLGRKGDLIRAKPGYVRNFLLPTQKAVLADVNTLRLRERLQEERAKQAELDKKESEELARVINDKSLTVEVKVDPDGNMYGSVSAGDIIELLKKHNIVVEKQFVQLPQPIKKLGTHSIALHLKEGVPATFTLNVHGEGLDQNVNSAAEAEGEGESFSPSTR